MNVLLNAAGVQKSFGGAPALRDGRLEVRGGEIHALMGANGAGKSTLLKILTGVYSRDDGIVDFAVDGVLAPAEISNPRDADRLGIAIVHQELILSDNLSVADNLSLGTEPTMLGGLVLDSRATREYARSALETVGLRLNPSTMVSDLSTAEKQLVEIARSLARNAKLLILDEPTTSLTDSESKKLFAVLGNLRDAGIAIVYVSHRMEEIFDICDRITVMRDGSYVDTLVTSETSRAELIPLMIGRSLASEYEHATATTGELGAPVLTVTNLSTTKLLRGVNLEVRQGEIVGMFGLIGAGRTEVARAVFGLDPVSNGQVAISQKPLSRRTPQKAIAAGLGLVPEDRKSAGLVLDMSIANNLELAALRRSSFVQWTGSTSRTLWERYRDRLGIVARNRRQPVGTLSGGNQQKVVLGKWLALEPSVLILDEPTRGVDVGAKDDIYAVIRELADSGAGVLVISSEIEEILMVSSRVIVMREGSITLDSPRAGLESHTLLEAAMGENS